MWCLENPVTLECSEAFEFRSKIENTEHMKYMRQNVGRPSIEGRSLGNKMMVSVGLENELFTWVTSSGYAFASAASENNIRQETPV